MALTQKNKFFIQEYIKQNYTNAAAAWQKVYGCDWNSAKVQASKALKKQEVLDYMLEFQRQKYLEAGITAERIAMRLSEMAFDDEKDYSQSTRTKALDLLQKQLGLQTQKVDANVNQEQTIEVKIEN